MRLYVADATVDLEHGPDGQANWRPAGAAVSVEPAAEPATEARWPVHELVLERVRLRYHDAPLRTDLRLHVSTVDAAATELWRTQIELNGSYRSLPLQGRIRTGAVLSLQYGDQPFPFSADLQMVGTRLNATGELLNPLLGANGTIADQSHWPVVGSALSDLTLGAAGHAELPAARPTDAGRQSPSPERD
jgi:uncharacterized protein involved in outer membrane biogenesis